MEIIGVVMLSFAVCFITLIITLVFFNFIILMSEEDEPKTKVLTREYDAQNKQDSQELFDTGKMSPIRRYKCDNFMIDDCSWYQRDVNEAQEKYLETLPHHKTRVKNRSKRQRKK